MIPVYRENPYLSELTTVVDRIEVDSASGGKILFCRENLFSEGGGQPRDYGSVKIAEQSFPVASLIKQKGNVGLLVHGLDILEKGAEIVCNIDFSRRLKIMRLHTAQHTLAACIKRILKNYQSRGMSISENAQICSMFFSLPEGEAQFGKQQLSDALGHFSEIIDTGYEVSAVQCESMSEAEKLYSNIFRASDPGLSFKGKVRIVVIDRVDANACGGTHVKSTHEIGEIKVNTILFDDLLGIYCLDFQLK